MARNFNKNLNSRNNNAIITNNNIQNNISLVGFGSEELMERLTRKDEG